MRKTLICAVMAMAAAALPADAARREGLSVAAQYVRARAADAAGMPELAAAQYAEVLNASPDDEVLAMRTYRQAIMAGDRALALRAAHVLASKPGPPPDVRLLLLVDAIGARDWREAGAIADKIEEEDVLAFLVPTVRAWIAFGARERDPLIRFDGGRAGSLAAAYAPEHRALMLLALGRTEEGITALRALGLQDGGRAARLRIAAAAAITGSRPKGQARDKALALLDGDGPALVAARERLRAGKPLPAPVDSAAAGIAELFVRVAMDVNRERVTPLAMALARASTFLAPRSAEGWIVTAELLSSAEQFDAAALALAEVATDDPLAAAAREARVQLLVRKGEKETALKEALAVTAAPGARAADWIRLGDLYIDLTRPADAAQAYGKALDLVGKGETMSRPWMLWMVRGGALEQAGQWAEAKVALRKAVELAPDQAVVLNYLGYALLDRKEDLDEAARLIRRASELKPDDAAITDSLGWVHFVRGDVRGAIPILERAVAGEPAEPTINEHLGDAYWSVGRRFEARYAWAAALVYADEESAVRIRQKLESGLETAAR